MRRGASWALMGAVTCQQQSDVVVPAERSTMSLMCPFQIAGCFWLLTTGCEGPRHYRSHRQLHRQLHRYDSYISKTATGSICHRRPTGDLCTLEVGALMHAQHMKHLQSAARDTHSVSEVSSLMCDSRPLARRLLRTQGRVAHLEVLWSLQHHPCSVVARKSPEPFDSAMQTPAQTARNR